MIEHRAAALIIFWHLVRDMKVVGPVCFGAVAILIAIFLAGDADLTILYAPAVPEDGFKDKVVWITGASSGIGAALAMDLVNMNAKVILSARRVDKLNEVASNCRGDHKPYVLPLDMVDLKSHQTAYDEIIKEYGKIDIIVLNAGRSQRNPAIDTKFEDTKALMDLNFLSCVHLAKVVLPDMVSNGNGQIVLMSSISAHIATPIASSYSASKFALVIFYVSCWLLNILTLAFTTARILRFPAQ